jgi:hypothetical protein
VTRPRYVTLVLGDWNEDQPAIRAVAEKAGATFVRGYHVDNAVVHGLKPVDVQRLAPGGSDHHPILYTFEVDSHRIVALAWNVYEGQDPKAVRRRLAAIITRFRPNVIALSEAYHCGPELEGLAAHRGYHLSQGPNVGEQADCALLVRDDRPIASPGPARMREPWVGPKHGLAKRPREYPRARYHLAPGLVLRVAAVHLPFGDKPLAESNAWIVRWIKNGAR